ncbi:FAR1-related protein [Striga asiatica]|uniref:FAR1-related protein n=1 Tax=Striga asiatica TaxID=4170 RepID=A0A5A7QKF8_STRAF|nr:FAR1-related protein [Striga asiatica]
MDDVLIVDSENANFEESGTARDNETGINDSISKVGMQFPNEKEVSHFYMRYPYATGFLVRKRSSGKDDDGVLRYVTFTCSSEGRINSSTRTSMKPQPISNTGFVEAGGYENITFVEKDCRNYVEQARRLRLGEGDAAAIQSYFSNMQA